MNWVFKAKQLDYDVSTKTEFIRLYVKRSFSGKPNDKVLILDKLTEGWAFTSLYEIEKIDDPAKGRTTEERRVITITVRFLDKYTDKLLEDYIYSLKRVYNFGQPINHFKRYSRLNDEQFGVIANDEINYTRSVLGTVLNALPGEHQQAFIAYLAIEQPKLLQDQIDYTEALNYLSNYLQFAIIHPATCLVEAGRMLREISPDEAGAVALQYVPANDVEKTAGNNNQPILCNVLRQVEIIQEHLLTLRFDSNSELGVLLANDRRNERNNNGFRSTGLPLKLKS